MGSDGGTRSYPYRCGSEHVNCEHDSGGTSSKRPPALPTAERKRRLSWFIPNKWWRPASQMEEGNE